MLFASTRQAGRGINRLWVWCKSGYWTFVLYRAPRQWPIPRTANITKNEVTAMVGETILNSNSSESSCRRERGIQAGVMAVPRCDRFIHS
jgi:hypothetical protein